MAASIAGSYYFSRTFTPRRRGRVLPERGLRGAAEVHAPAPAREAVGLDEGIQGDFEAECRRAGDGGLDVGEVEPRRGPVAQPQVTARPVHEAKWTDRDVRAVGVDVCSSLMVAASCGGHTMS